MTKEALETAAGMLDPRVVQQETAMKEVRRLIGDLDPRAAQRMDQAGRGRIPNSQKSPNEVVTYLAEAVAVLAQAVAEGRKPRPRGRPPKRAA